MKNIRIVIFLAAMWMASGLSAQQQQVAADTLQNNQVNPEDVREMVIVGNDTVDVIIPEKNFGRYDRGLFNYLFIPKGQWSLGITASYGSIDSDDFTFLSVVDDLNLNGTIYSVKPYVSYFFKSNSSIGMRLGYNKTNFDLNSLAVDLGDDLNFDIHNVVYNYEYYSASVFYRHYIGLDNGKRFGIFNEVDLSFGSGTGRFLRYYKSEPRDTRTDITECRLNFSPGLCVFFHDYVSFNISFGVLGFYFKNEKQKTNEVEEGSRFSSGADFKVNLFNINLGIAVHI